MAREASTLRLMKEKHRSVKKAGAAARISQKISVLRHEGKPQAQAVAMSYAMEKSGRLRAGGDYERKGS